MNEIVTPITEDGQVGFDSFGQLCCWKLRGDGSRVGTIIDDVRNKLCVLCRQGWELSADAMFDQYPWRYSDAPVHLSCLIRHEGVGERIVVHRTVAEVFRNNSFRLGETANRYWPPGDPWVAKPWYTIDLLDYPQVATVIGRRKRVWEIELTPRGHSFDWWAQAANHFSKEGCTMIFGPEKLLIHAWGDDRLRIYLDSFRDLLSEFESPGGEQ